MRNGLEADCVKFRRDAGIGIYRAWQRRVARFDLLVNFLMRAAVIDGTQRQKFVQYRPDAVDVSTLVDGPAGPAQEDR